MRRFTTFTTITTPCQASCGVYSKGPWPKRAPFSSTAKPLLAPAAAPAAAKQEAEKTSSTSSTLNVVSKPVPAVSDDAIYNGIPPVEITFASHSATLKTTVPWAWIEDHDLNNFRDVEHQRIDDIPRRSTVDEGEDDPSPELIASEMEETGVATTVDSINNAVRFHVHGMRRVPSVPISAFAANFAALGQESEFTNLTSSVDWIKGYELSDAERSRGYTPAQIRWAQSNIEGFTPPPRLREAIRQCSSSARSRHGTPTCIRHSSIDSEVQIVPSDLAPKVHYIEVGSDDKDRFAAQRRAALKALDENGFVIIESDVLASLPDPSQGATTTDTIISHREAAMDRLILRLFGVIRNTHYGGTSIWGPRESKRIRSSGRVEEAAHVDTAYQTVGIGLHTDSSYLSEPPRVQAFGCIFNHVSETRGGENTLCDGFAVAQSLLRDEPEMFHRLASTAVPAFYAKEGHNFSGCRPTFDVQPVSSADEQHAKLLLRAVTCNRYDRAPTLFNKKQLPDAKSVDHFYASYAEFLRRCDANVVQLTPNVGEMLIFDNWRMLHAREAFYGPRVMCGAYVGADDYLSAMRSCDV